MSSRYEPHADYASCELPSWNEMPSHWRIGRIKYMTELNPSKSEVRHLKADTPVTFLPMESIGDDGSLDVSKERPLHSVLNGYTYLAEGDVCVAKITPCFENGKGAIASGLRNGIGFATTEVIPMRCNRYTDSQFLYYFLTCAPFNLEAEASMYGAGGQKRVADSFVANYSTAIPPLAEQQQIASFLDYETAKIDALMEKQQQLIALLGEKRQAVISHAVTKGLNPDAPMRDSGVEWLGDVPEHWEISRAKYVFEEQNRPVRDCDEIVTSFRDGQVCLRTRRRSTGYTMAILEHGYQGIRRGDLVVHSMDAFAGAIGVSEDDGRATPEYVVVKPFEEKMNCNYFAKILRVMAERDFIFVLCPSVRERAPRFRFARLQEILLPIPPSTEQDEIINYLASVQDKLDGLQEKAEHQVEVLQERRTALISAAVTGKIDVRGWKPPLSGAKQETEMEIA